MFLSLLFCMQNILSVEADLKEKKKEKNPQLCVFRKSENNWRGKKGETEAYNENLKLTQPAFL